MGLRKVTGSFLANKYGKPKTKLPPNIAAGLTPAAMQKKLNTLTRKAEKRNAKEFHALVNKNVRGNAYGFSNDPQTTARKGSDIPWMHDGELIDAFVVEKTEVKFKDGNHSSGLPYSELAMILEYGTKDKHILPMDVLRRSFEDFKETAKKNIEETFDV